MITHTVEQLAFDFFPHLPVVVQRHDAPLTGDAGLLPIAQFDRRWRYTQRLAACIDLDAASRDPGQRRFRPMRQHHALPMVRQRVMGILAGYEDCNDHDTLRSEPVFKLIAGNLPDGKNLASQPTLSRFENTPDPKSLQRVIDFLIDTGVERLRETHGGALPGGVTLDLDATDDATHGHQQLTLFHGYYGQHQYFPLILSEPTTRHIFVAWLRHGTAHASLGADDDLLRVVKALRASSGGRPDVAIHVRADSGFGLPRIYEACERNGLTYTLGFTCNVRLKAMTEGLVQQAVEQYEKTREKQRLFMCFEYQCDSWDRPRTVIAKAECHAGGTNLRFVVTNLPDVTTAADAERVYDDYIQRGESEHRMDELKNGLKMDRLSCHRFMANFFRLLLHTAAMNLLNALRSSASLPEILRNGQPCTWRMCVIKVAAVVRRSTRRVVVELAGGWPWWTLFKAAGERAMAFTGGP